MTMDSPAAASSRLAAAPALNPEQQAAAAHRGGPLLVLAGAGTGKTMTLAARVAQRVLDGADPQRLLLLTFSRRAAQQLVQRAGRLLHQALGLPATTPPPLLPWAGTFHAVAARLLRQDAAAIGLPPAFTVVDRADAEDLMAGERERLGLGGARGEGGAGGRPARRFPLAATALAIHSRCVNRQAPLAAVLAQDYPWCAEAEAGLRALFAAYAAEKRAQAVLDYDDLLLAWHALLQVPELAQALAARFDEVLVDEYQDTNRLQAAILHALKPDGRGLTVVGDDAQSIYGFRAAEVGNILGFAQRFEPPARVVVLDRNYRSTQPLLDLANALIGEDAQASRKRLWSPRAAGARPRLVTVADELAQARAVADAVLERREQGLKLKHQAVLFRASHHSAVLELELARRGIPFVKFGGLRFLEAAHVKDLLAVLRWAHNPACRLAAWRVAQRVPGLGPASVRRLVDAIAAADPGAALPGADAAWCAVAAFQPPPRAAEAWAELHALLAALARSDSPWPGELDAVRAWYTPQLERLYPDDAAQRQRDLDQLVLLARASPDRARFLTDLALDPPEASSDDAGPPFLDEDYLILSTLHSAKGQEWSAVSILNVVDGCIPSDLATGDAAQLAEERRLLYVGATRAREQLDLMVPLRFHVTQQHRSGDRHLYGGLSRFVTPAVAACCERVLAGEPAAATAPAAAALPAGCIDLGHGFGHRF